LFNPFRLGVHEGMRPTNLRWNQVFIAIRRKPKPRAFRDNLTENFLCTLIGFCEWGNHPRPDGQVVKRSLVTEERRILALISRLFNQEPLQQAKACCGSAGGSPIFALAC
jgi:hypothetical protein